MTYKEAFRINFNISGKPRIEKQFDGLYVVGNDLMIPVKAHEAEKVLEEELGAYELERRSSTYKRGVKRF